MKAEKILIANNIPVTLVPTPRKISSDCGMAIQVDCKDLTQAKSILDNEGLTIEGTFELET
jgi:hypothetical protein